MKTRLSACLLIALSMPATLASAEEAKTEVTVSSTQEKDIATLRSLAIKSGEAFNAKDPDGIMSLYAPDVLISYPGIPDMGYEDFAKAYANMLKPTPGVTVKTAPTIEEILVSGDLGVIRILWNTTTTETNPPREHTRQMKDLQVWRRQADGSWKLSRGMHYRVSEGPSPTNES